MRAGRFEHEGGRVRDGAEWMEMAVRDDRRLKGARHRLTLKREGRLGMFFSERELRLLTPSPCATRRSL